MMNQTKATETGWKSTLFAFRPSIIDRFVIIGKFGTPYAPRAHTVIELLWMRRMNESKS